MKKGCILSILIIIILVTISFTGCYSDENNDVEDEQKIIDLELTISTDHSNYTSGNPIIINISLKNKGSEAIDLSELQIAKPGSIELILIDSKNIIYKDINDPTRNFSRRSNLTVVSPGGVTVGPDDHLSLYRDISETYWLQNNTSNTSQVLLNNPGSFSLYAIYTSNKFDTPVWEGTIESNTIEFNIV